MTFQIQALDPALFAGLFSLSDTELARQNMRTMTVAAKPGTPCRVSLADAEVGETVLLINHAHQSANSPYRASHAIFVRQGVMQARPAVGEVPEVIRSRLISVRLFDCADMMVDADVVEGVAVAQAIERAFDDPVVAYIHLHNAKPGCFAASVQRA
jgi:hypothetical protein